VLVDQDSLLKAKTDSNQVNPDQKDSVKLFIVKILGTGLSQRSKDTINPIAPTELVRFDRPNLTACLMPGLMPGLND
jgi:hypothetical protein